MAAMAALDSPLREIVIDLQRGHVSEDGFRLLFQRYYRPVVRFFQQKQLSPEDAKELAQDVFVAVYKGIGRLQDADRFEGWLFALTRNVLYNYLDRVHAHKRSALKQATARADEDGMAQDPVDLLTDGRKDPLADLIDREQVVLVRDEMMKLPQQMRVCVMMRVLEESSIEEIASRQSLSVNTVKSHLTRARHLLREKLEPEFGVLDFSDEGRT